jgi:translocation and assembly module TamB
MVRLQNADLEPASKGHITFNASSGLSKWSFTNTSPIQVNLEASQVNITDLTQLAGQQIPVTGVLNAKLAVHGSELNPEGTGNISLTNVNAYEQPVKLFKLDFAGNGNEAHGELSANLSAGSLQSKVSIRPREKTYDAQLTSSGIHLDQLEALKARNINATGVVTLNAHGQGSFDNPAASATIQIPTLVVQNQTIFGVNLRVDLANHVANAQLETSAVNTSVQAKAKVDLTGDYIADASLDTQQIPLQPLFALYAPSLGATATGETEVHATLHGPLKNKKLLEAHRESCGGIAYPCRLQERCD